MMDFVLEYLSASGGTVSQGCYTWNKCLLFYTELPSEAIVNEWALKWCDFELGCRVALTHLIRCFLFSLIYCTLFLQLVSKELQFVQSTYDIAHSLWQIRNYIRIWCLCMLQKPQTYQFYGYTSFFFQKQKQFGRQHNFSICYEATHSIVELTVYETVHTDICCTTIHIQCTLHCVSSYTLATHFWNFCMWLNEIQTLISYILLAWSLIKKYC